ncbi:MAG: DegV family protein [Anaerolineales bacterium]
MPNFRIITDSPSDVPAELVAQYRMIVLPAYINFSAAESVPDDGVAITKTDFYERLAKAELLPTTAAYSPGEAEKAMRHLLEDEGAEHVFSIHTTKGVSAMVESSRIAAREVGEDKVTVLDTGSLSMGSGWCVVGAARAIAAGADYQGVLDAFESIKARVDLITVPSTMEYLRRSGRVNSMVAGVGDVLQIKPFVRVLNGEVTRAGRVRTEKKIIPKLVDMARDYAPLESVAILHTGYPEGAAALEAALQAALGDLLPADCVTTIVTPAIGANFGPGGVGIAMVRKAQ